MAQVRSVRAAQPRELKGWRARLGMCVHERRNLRNGLLFVLPWLLGFIAFTVVPLVSSLYYSFTSYDVLRPPHWVGLNNYVRLFTTDPYIPGAVANTLYLAALG